MGANGLNAADFFSESKLARVIVSKAIVYSDESMMSPIGHIINNKLIKVGNPRKKNPYLVPVVVYGRLAYIELKNIKLESDSNQTTNIKGGEVREHNIDLLLMKPEEKLNQNNSIFFYLNNFLAGDQTANLFETIEGTPSERFIGIGADLIHRNSMSSIFWGLGYEYNTISSENIFLDFFQFNPTIGFTPVKNSIFLLDLSFSYDFSLNGQFKIKNNYTLEPSPFYYGPHLSARFLLFPNQKYHLTGTFGYRNYKVIGIQTLTDANNSAIDGITKISGISGAIGFGFEL